MRVIPLLQIRTGTEGASISSQDSAAQGRFGIHPFEERVEFVVALCVDAVEGRRAVECYEEDRRRWERDNTVLDMRGRCAEFLFRHFGRSGSKGIAVVLELNWRDWSRGFAGEPRSRLLAGCIKSGVKRGSVDD